MPNAVRRRRAWAPVLRVCWEIMGEGQRLSRRPPPAGTRRRGPGSAHAVAALSLSDVTGSAARSALAGRFGIGGA